MHDKKNFFFPSSVTDHLIEMSRIGAKKRISSEGQKGKRKVGSGVAQKASSQKQRNNQNKRIKQKKGNDETIRSAIDATWQREMSRNEKRRDVEKEVSSSV